MLFGSTRRSRSGTEHKWHHLFATYDGSSKAKGVHIYVDGKPADLDYTHDTLTESDSDDGAIHYRASDTRRAVSRV